MIPEVVSNHEAEALELLTEQFKGKLVTEAWVKTMAGRAQVLEGIVWDVIHGRLLADCVGVWLDAYGAIVGEPRRGRDDTNYRFAIRVRIRVNLSKGRAEDVIQVARLLDGSASYVEYFPLAWEVEIYDTPYGGDFAGLLKQTKAATSYGVLLTSSWPVSDVSQFSDAGEVSPSDTFESAI